MENTYVSKITGQVIKPSTYWMMQAARYNEHTTASEKEEFLAMYGVSALRVWIAMHPETEWKEQTVVVSEGPVLEPQPIVPDPFLSMPPEYEEPSVLETIPNVSEAHLAIQPVLEQPTIEPNVIPVEVQGEAPTLKRKGLLAAISSPFSRKKREEVAESAEPAGELASDDITEPTVETSVPIQSDDPIPVAPVDQLPNKPNEQTYVKPDQPLPSAPSPSPLDDQTIPMPPKRPKAMQTVLAPPARPRTVRENPAPPLRPKSTAAVIKPGTTTPSLAVNNYSKEDLWRMAKTDPYYDETATEDNGVVIREARFNIKLILVVVVCLVVVVGGAISIALILS